MSRFVSMRTRTLVPVLGILFLGLAGILVTVTGLVDKEIRKAAYLQNQTEAARYAARSPEKSPAG